MKVGGAPSRQAWQPLTPPGVAAFATASTGRLLGVQLIFAAMAGVAATVFAASAWFPAIGEGIQHLPPQGCIQRGELVWTGDSPTLLARNHWLAITVDLKQDPVQRWPTDVQVEFSARRIRFISLAGYLDIPYPRGWVIVFNEPELGAWWGAWAPFLAAGLGILTAGASLLAWQLLALVYTLPVKAVCRFVEHGLVAGAAWRICGAAQLPGSLLASFALLLYSVRAIDLVQWLFVVGAQLVMGWIYLFLAPFFLPAQTAGRQRTANPFGRA